jgi:hypothetical protein
MRKRLSYYQGKKKFCYFIQRNNKIIRNKEVRQQKQKLSLNGKRKEDMNTHRRMGEWMDGWMDDQNCFLGHQNDVW